MEKAPSNSPKNLKRFFFRYSGFEKENFMLSYKEKLVDSFRYHEFYFYGNRMFLCFGITSEPVFYG